MQRAATRRKARQTSRTSVASSSVAERRSLRRPAPVQLLTQPQSKVVNATLVDVSVSGIGLRTNVPIPPGTELDMQLPNAEVGVPLRYRVARCRPLGHGQFHIGAAFVRVTGNQEARP